MLCLHSDGQIFIDEIAGKAAAQHGSVRSPVALLNKLIQLDEEGGFNPAYAAKVKQVRDTKQSQVQPNQMGLATDVTTQLTDTQRKTPNPKLKIK